MKRPLPGASLVLAIILHGVAQVRGDCLVPYAQTLSPFDRRADFLAATDVNHDGKPDLAGSSATGVFLALNGGSGLNAPADVHTGAAAGGLAAADVDHDTHIDLVFAGGTSLFTRLGNGDGTFDAALETPVGITPAAIAVARIDNDVHPDLVAYDPTQATVVFFRGNATGGFTESSRKTIGAGARAMHAADLDADGWTDVVIAYQTGSTYHAFYGRGDGTFDDAVDIHGRGDTRSLKADDLTGDHLPDLVGVDYYGVWTIRNLGGRAFSDPLYYTSNTYGLQDLAIADLTGDGVPDPMVPMTCGYVNWRSTGIGTLTYRWFQEPYDYGSCYELGYLEKSPTALADFDGDGRTDIVASIIAGYASPAVRRFRNLCGDSVVALTAQSPVISTGQTAVLRPQVGPPPEQRGWLLATGTVTLREGDTVKGTGTLNSNGEPISFSIDALSLGDHTFVASYDGDAQYEPNESAPLTVRVTTATTTTTLLVDPAEGVFGVAPQIRATVTSSAGTTPSGPIRFIIDEAQPYGSYTAPSAMITAFYDVGTHTYTAKFLGDATHPPSSATITYVIEKQTPKLSMTPVSTVAGTAATVSISVLPVHGSTYPTGTATVTEGTTTLASVPLPSYPYFNLELPVLAVGRHDLRISYSGDANFKATEVISPFIVFPSAESSIDARGTAAGVTVTWYAPNQLIVMRRRYDQAWGAGGGMCCGSAPWLDTGVTTETVYLYRMESHDHLTWSNTDVGVRISFTDEPLLPGMTIKAVHFREVIRATNLLRVAANLSTVPEDQIVTGSVVTAASLTTLRNAINEARVALGAYPFAFTGTVVPGALITAAHFRELREAVR